MIHSFVFKQIHQEKMIPQAFFFDFPLLVFLSVIKKEQGLV
jgi:hypothetical protein